MNQPRASVTRLSEALRPWSNRSLLGTGVGVAGDVDTRKGVVRFSANLGWRRVALAGLFRKFKFPSPIVLDNDANAAAWGGYHLELGARPKSLITLTLGTGVGGGLVLDGELYRLRRQTFCQQQQKVCKKRRLNLRFKKPFARPAPFRLF